MSENEIQPARADLTKPDLTAERTDAPTKTPEPGPATAAQTPTEPTEPLAPVTPTEATGPAVPVEFAASAETGQAVVAPVAPVEATGAAVPVELAASAETGQAVVTPVTPTDATGRAVPVELAASAETGQAVVAPVAPAEATGRAVPAEFAASAETGQAVVAPVAPAADAGVVAVAESTVPVAPAESVAPPVPARDPARRRRRVAALVGSLLLAAGVIGGVGYTVVTVDDADRDAGAPQWTFPKATPETAKPASAKGLAGMLVPYGTDSWGRGPDIGEYGYDATLSGARATALRKESLSGLPRTQRKALEKQLDKQRLQGIVMRSYLSSPYADKASTVTVELSELANSSAVREISGYQRELVDVLDGILRKGPAIKGHKDARCFLAPEDKDEKLDSMVCFAHQGNVLISLTADSPKPMDQKGVAMLLREQLDRIAEPGEAV